MKIDLIGHEGGNAIGITVATLTGDPSRMGRQRPAQDTLEPFAVVVE